MHFYVLGQIQCFFMTKNTLSQKITFPNIFANIVCVYRGEGEEKQMLLQLSLKNENCQFFHLDFLLNNIMYILKTFNTFTYRVIPNINLYNIPSVVKSIGYICTYIHSHIDTPIFFTQCTCPNSVY